MRRILFFAVALVCCAQEPPDIKVDVGLVTVATSVSNREGAPVKNLRREDFELLDDGKPREVQYFWQETDLPLTIGLIADVSGSQMGEISKHREDLTRFLAQVMSPRDRAFLVTVGGQVKLVTDLTSSIEELSAGVDGIELRRGAGTQLGEPCGRRRRGCGTPLWDGIFAAARLKMRPLSGRKALIVLSDGLDAGSSRNLTDAIEAAQSADTLVYTIRSFGMIARFSPMTRIRATVSNPMRRLSAETGGKAFSSPPDPTAIFAEIADDLRNLYVLGFTPPEAARDGKFHKLEVKIPKTGGTIRARKGYTAQLR